MMNLQQPIGVCIAVIDPTSERVLMGKRLRAYKAGWYGLPGGRVDVGEPLIECVKRELWEETSLQGQGFTYLGTVREFQQSYDFIHFAFLCQKFTGRVRLTEPDKCEKWEWFSVN